MKTRRGIVAALVAGVALFCLPAVALASSPSTTSSQATATVQRATLQPTWAEKMALDLINKQRTKRGLCSLKLNDALTSAARAHSSEMGSRQFFSHSSSNGESFAARISRFGYSRSGYRSWMVGENIYWGAGLYGTAVAAVDGWMHSASHRAVILTPGFREIGIGAVDCPNGYGRAKGTVTFFTMDVGRRSK